MMTNLDSLANEIQQKCNTGIQRLEIFTNELTITVDALSIQDVCLILKEDAQLKFNLLIDVCGVDYLHYGVSEWQTESATETGFSRGVQTGALANAHASLPRFAVVYHLLSLEHNHRVRIKAFLEEKNPSIASVINIWPAANWFEREAFDLFGIVFTGHSDLRRLLTDYGFIGHPFRKDFPLIGKVEARYDAKEKRVVYEPVSIQPRVLEPKVIRDDARYTSEDT